MHYLPHNEILAEASETPRTYTRNKRTGELLSPQELALFDLAKSANQPTGQKHKN
jgi:hypothetical protein